MLNLKPAYDAVNAADAELKAKAAEIAALFEQGDETAALALQESLDTLQAKYDNAKGMYEKLVNATRPSDVAANFVPASPSASEEDKPKDVMTFDEFNALDPKSRLAFAKRGGKIQPKED